MEAPDASPSTDARLHLVRRPEGHLWLHRGLAPVCLVQRTARYGSVPTPGACMKHWRVATFVTVAALGFLLVMIWLA